MNLSDLFKPESAGAFSIAVGLMLFVVSHEILKRFLKDKSSPAIIALVLSILSSYALYKTRFVFAETIIGILFLAFVLVIALKLISALIRFTKFGFGRQ